MRWIILLTARIDDFILVGLGLYQSQVNVINHVLCVDAAWLRHANMNMHARESV